MIAGIVETVGKKKKTTPRWRNVGSIPAAGLRNMKIEADPKELITKTADSRGRITLGSEYAGDDVTVLVVETGE